MLFTVSLVLNLIQLQRGQLKEYISLLCCCNALSIVLIYVNECFVSGQGRELFTRMLEVFVLKFKTISETQLPFLLNKWLAVLHFKFNSV